MRARKSTKAPDKAADRQTDVWPDKRVALKVTPSTHRILFVPCAPITTVISDLTISPLPFHSFPSILTPTYIRVRGVHFIIVYKDTIFS